jgi:uncharacterized alkaline shock family protein YloU
VNIFNRIVTILLILVAFFVVTIGLFVPAESLAVIRGTADNTLNTMNRIRPEFILLVRVLLVLCAMFLDILLVGLLVREVRGPAKHTLRVQKVGGGEVAVTAESLVERLQYQIDQLADVVGVKARVAPRGGGVDVEVNLQTSADVNVPEKAEQVLEVTRQVVEDKMGLKLARKPRVNVHAMPTPGVPARAITPARPFHSAPPDQPKTPPA